MIDSKTFSILFSRRQMSRQGRFLSTPLELLSQSLAKTSSMMFRFMEDKYENHGGFSAPVSERRIDDPPTSDDQEDRERLAKLIESV